MTRILLLTICLLTFGSSVSGCAMSQQPSPAQNEFARGIMPAIKWVVAPVAVGAGLGYTAGSFIGYEGLGAVVGGCIGIQLTAAVLAVRPFIPGRW